MLNKKIGFIGCGNMTKAIINGIVKSQVIAPENIWVFDRKPATNQEMVEKYGLNTAESPASLAGAVDILVAAVKPNVIGKVLGDIAGQIKKETLVVSIAAGVTLETLAGVLGDSRKIIRVMPNTPALVGEGMSSVTPNALVTADETAMVLQIFQSFGKAEQVSEYLIHSVVGVSGSSPAYIFMLIEAMADAAVLGGMPRKQAYEFAAQAVKGAAQMVLETGLHPAQLKDSVCSPGGTTIEAVQTLESQGFRAAVMLAMQKCMEKSEALSNK